MILSVSRRTDIPNYYSEWFYNRIKEGFLYVRNPMNTHQISKINLSPELTDCIVFWTKNPADMIPRLDELQDYNYCFQFTLTGYGRDIEANVPEKRHHITGVFQKLSEKTGSEKMIWRYDPILFNKNYDPDYHLKAFEEIAGTLTGYTGKVTVSLIDLYEKTKRNTKGLNIKELPYSELAALIHEMEKIAKKNNMELLTCAAQNKLTAAGIKGVGCVEKAWIEEITGCRLKAKGEKTQRKDCACIESIDVGTYNTCMNGCKYCYANYSEERVSAHFGLYDVNSPLLCGHIEPGDKITERKIKSLKDSQGSLFDL